MSDTTKPEIVVSEFMDAGAVDDLKRDYATLYDPALVDWGDDLRAALAGARALIVRNRTRVGADLLAAAPNLVVVGRLGVGLDNIDLDACGARGIEVRPATGANDRSVAEYAITGVLMLLRGAYHAGDEVAAGDWPRNRLIGREVFGRTLGLVGFGRIARATAALAQGLGMKIVAFDPGLPADDSSFAGAGVARAADLDALLDAADAVSLHVPMTPTTRNLIDAEALARMRSGAVLVNAARGGVVDEAALADALRRGHLGGAMLDVFASEPLPAGSALAGAPNLILTPHIAGVTEESNVRVSAAVASAVREVLHARR